MLTVQLEGNYYRAYKNGAFFGEFLHQSVFIFGNKTELSVTDFMNYMVR